MQSNQTSNKTQCPHCFTIYQISEGQLAQSKGNVRCGNCHERFKAQLLSDDEIKQARLKVAPNNDLFADANKQSAEDPSASTTEQSPNQDAVDPGDIVDEKTSVKEDAIEGSERSIANIDGNNQLDVDENPFKDLALERRSPEATKTSEDRDSSRTINEGRKEPVFDFELEDSELELPSFGTSKESSFNAKSINKDLDFIFDEPKDNLSTPDTEEVSESNSPRFSEPASQDPSVARSKVAKSKVAESNTSAPSDNQELISEIDRIIDNRLLNGTDSEGPNLESPSLKIPDDRVQTEQAKRDLVGEDVNERESVRSIDWVEEISHDVESSNFEDALDNNSENSSDLSWVDEDDLFVEPSDKPGRKGYGALSFLKLAATVMAIIGLIVLLAYQVWLKQFGFVINNEPAQTTLNALFTPTIDYLEDKGVALARPKNLTGIALISAQSEPHPSRSSTTLLKISFLNKSSVEQSVPWLELSLTDESGKVVARRALQPEDYLFNNTTQARIGPHELKKITIELLAFPKSATGFELKMLKSMSS